MAMRRKRRSACDGDFCDPLKNYNEPDYSDPLERSLMEDEIRDMKITPFVSVPPDQTIKQTIEQLTELKVACALVVEDDKIVGIFSERDVLMKVANRYAELKDKPVSQVMTADPEFIYRTDSPAKALYHMAISGFRHVPIVNADEKVAGILGPRRVTRYLQQHFVA